MTNPKPKGAKVPTKKTANKPRHQKVSKLLFSPKKPFNKSLAFAIAGALAIFGIYVVYRSHAATTSSFTDSFDGTDGIVTSSNYYQSAAFPGGGTSTAANPSTIWEGDSGTFYRQSNWGYSGRPVDWINKYFFRFNTRNFNIGDAAITWQYRSAPFGQDGYAVESSDATDVWLRYQTQYNLYAWQFDRTNNCFQVKRKIPAEGWSGPASDISNRGVYYTIPTDVNQPVVGAGKFCIAWSSVASVLPASEQAKPGYPNLAHDITTSYDFKVTAQNTPDGKVQIQAYRAGALIYSATDDGKIGIAADGLTEGQHIASGYYNCCISSFQQSWLLPITNAGASGFRADNIKFWLNDFTVTDLSIPSTDNSAPSQPIGLTATPQSASQINLSWAASTDNVGVTGYDVYRNNAKLTTIGINNFADTGLVASTNYSYYVIARDAAGNSSPASAIVSATTQATPPVVIDNPPTTTITSPLNGSTIGSSLTVKASATDDHKVTKLEVWFDGVIKCTTSSNSLSCGINTRKTASGAHTITAKAYDAAGNVGTGSVTVYK